MARLINQAFINDGTMLDNTSDIIDKDLYLSSPLLFNLLSTGSPSGKIPITINWTYPVITGTTSAGLWQSLFRKSIKVSNLDILSTVRAADQFFQANMSGTTTKYYSTNSIIRNSDDIFSTVIDSGRAENFYRKGGIFGDEISDELASTPRHYFSTGPFGYHGGGIFRGIENNSPEGSSYTATNCYNTELIVVPMGDKLYGPFYTSGSPAHVQPCFEIDEEPGSDSSIISKDTGISSPTILLPTESPNTPLPSPQPCNNDTTLSAVYVNGELLSATPSNEYTYQFNSSESPISFHIVTVDPLATVSLNGWSGLHDISEALQLVPNTNSFIILVTAQNGDTTSYPLQINTPKSNDATLSQVYMNGELLSATPSNEYTYQFNSSELPISFNLVTTDPLATVSIHGWLGTHNILGTLPLIPDKNFFIILVTAQDGNSLTYPLHINIPNDDTTLAILTVNGVSIDLAANEYTYQNSSVSSISIIAVPTDDRSSVQINGMMEPIPGSNTITVVVIAQNGNTRSYPVKIYTPNDTTLSKVEVNGVLLLETPSNEYFYTFNSSERRIRVSVIANDNRSSVEVNGPRSNLMPGSNTITIVVTARNGKSKSYPLKIYTPLAAPTITITRTSNNTANLSWTAIKEADSYNVYQSTDNCTYTLLKNTMELSVIINTCLTTPLYIQVAAVDTVKMIGRLSDASIPLEFKWLPLAPTKLVSRNPASSTVKLDWSAPVDTENAGITAYTVYNGESIVLENITNTTVTLTGLKKNTLYTFQVSARNSEGDGPKSSESRIVTSQLASSIYNSTTFSREIATLKNNNFEAILSARAAIHNAGILMDRDRQKLIVAALNTINTTGETLAISWSNTKEILATMKTRNTAAAIDATKPVVVVIPNYMRFGKSGPYMATIYLDTATAEVQEPTKDNVSICTFTDIIEQSKAYIIFELPNSTPDVDYKLTLWHGSYSTTTLLYDGTDLIDQYSTKYTANELLRIGTLTIPLIGLGC